MYAIKTDALDPSDPEWTFPRQKTMYGGLNIAAGDRLYVFHSDSGHGGGTGLVAVGIVVGAAAEPRLEGVGRQTPRVSITVRRQAVATRRLGRAELKPFNQWDDGRPETELNFKFYRQATNKIVGLSAAACAFLDTFFGE